MLTRDSVVCLFSLIFCLLLRIYVYRRQEITNEHVLIKSDLYRLIFRNYIYNEFFHIFGIISLFIVSLVLNLNVYTATIQLLIFFLIENRNIDILYSLIGVNLLFVCITVNSRIRIVKYISSTFSGLLVSVSTFLLVEGYIIFFFPFFTYVFFWLKTYNLSRKKFELKDNIEGTVVIFLSSVFVSTFFLSRYFDFPKVVIKDFSNKDLFFSFPLAKSIAMISSFPSVFLLVDIDKRLLFISLIICSQLWRFIPLTSVDVELDILKGISTRLFNISALISISYSDSTLLCILISLPVQILYYMCYYFYTNYYM